MNNDKLIQAINDFKKNLNGQTISIHGKDYATVALRVGIARRNLGTSLALKSTVLHNDDKKVVVQSDAYIDGKHIASGLAEELRSSSRINQTSALENAETSAVGRALAFCSFISDGIASAEEVGLAIAQQDKQLTTALTELETVSHLGSYKSWLTKNQSLMKKVKDNNPIAYQGFLENFNKIKSKLETNGVIINGK
jgi:hypothetical protein